MAEGMAPPRSFQVIQDAYRTMYQRAIDPNFWVNLPKSGDWKKLGIYAIEAYGLFHIGQMVSSIGLASSCGYTDTLEQVGRRHIVGYKIDKKTKAEHH